MSVTLLTELQHCKDLLKERDKRILELECACQKAVNDLEVYERLWKGYDLRELKDIKELTETLVNQFESVKLPLQRTILKS